MGWVIDVAAGILRGSGRKELGEWLENAPAKLGEEIGKILQAGLESRGELSPDAVARLEELKDNNPVQPTRKSNDLLDEYLEDLNTLANLAAPLKAIAIRGFFHDRECVTLWVFHERLMHGFEIDEPKGEQRRIKISGSGADIFLLEPTDDDNLRQLNRNIERDIDGVMKKIDDHYYIEHVTKNDVMLGVTPTTTAILSGRERKCVPISTPKNIEEAFRTLPIARQAQVERLEQYRQDAENWRTLE